MLNNYPSFIALFSRYIIMLFLLLTLSCDKKPDDVISPVEEEKAIPQGSRKVSIKIDPSYDLNNTVAYSIDDSVSMARTEKALAVPNGSGALVFFLDKETYTVRAIAGVDSTENELTVNAKTVAASLLDLVPSYLSLNDSLRAEFASNVQTMPEYTSLILIVDKLLLNKEDVYSTNADFITQLMKINTIILNKYFPEINNKGGRMESTAEMTKWLPKEKAPQIANQVYSHVDAIFTPIYVDAKKPTISKEVIPAQHLLKIGGNITLLNGINDGYYQLELSQLTKRARDENFKELVQGVIQIFVGQMFGLAKAGSFMACTSAMTGAVNSKLTAATLSPPTNWKEGARLVLDIGMSTVITFATSDQCKKVFIDKAALAGIVAKKVNVWFGLIDQALLVKDALELGPWIISLWFDPIEFSEPIQVYKQKVIPGIVEFERIEGSVFKEYITEEKARPAVQAKILSRYDEIDLSAYNFEATWTVADGNGKVPSPKSPFSHDGKTVISWTLPMERGTYSIKADIADEDGDVLIGSPMKFETKAVESFENYELVITNVRPDYSKLSAVKTLKPFDALTVPNRLLEMIRLKYKGEYVKVGEHALEAENYYFKLDDYPVEAQDRYVGKYYISINDRTNNRMVKFPVDLTLNNKIYNSIIGRSIKVTGVREGTIVLNKDMTYNLTYSDGKEGKGGTGFHPLKWKVRKDQAANRCWLLFSNSCGLI